MYLHVRIDVNVSNKYLFINVKEKEVNKTKDFTEVAITFP